MKKKTRPVIDRALERSIEDENGCWLFRGATNAYGYGVIGAGRRGDGLLYTHRVTYEYFIAEIPEGLHLDHLCRVRACCNPWHVEPVTQGVNNQRMQDAIRRTHCRYGHEYTPENTGHWGTQRYCRACRKRNYRQKKETA